MVRVVFASCPPHPCSAKDSGARKNGTAMRGKEFSYSFFSKKGTKIMITSYISNDTHRIPFLSSSSARKLFVESFSREIRAIDTYLYEKESAFFLSMKGKKYILSCTGYLYAQDHRPMIFAFR